MEGVSRDPGRVGFSDVLEVLKIEANQRGEYGEGDVECGS